MLFLQITGSYYYCYYFYYYYCCWCYCYYNPKFYSLLTWYYKILSLFLTCMCILLWNNAPVCDLSTFMHLPVFLDLSQHSCSEEEWYLQKLLSELFVVIHCIMVIISFRVLFLIRFSYSTTSNIFTVQESRGFFKWKFDKGKQFLMFPCKEKNEKC